MPAIWLGILVFSLGAYAQTECAGCHAQQARAHLGTNHARAMRPILETEFYRSLPEAPIGEARGGFLLSYTAKANGLAATARRGDESASGVIGWAMGAGDQGVTPILRLGDSFLEHRISYYPRAGRFDLTLGHKPGASRSARAALGTPQPQGTILACFGCHATDVRNDFASFTAGVQCGRCHQGASAHAKGEAKASNPGKLAAKAQVEFCASCHRLTPPNGKTGDPVNVRFQPLRLALSRCYEGGKLSCLTCHDAHANARRDDTVFYRGKCLSCHPSQEQKGDCVSCHMPRSTPLPYLTFTDHYIRVAGSAGTGGVQGANQVRGAAQSGNSAQLLAPFKPRSGLDNAQ